MTGCGHSLQRRDRCATRLSLYGYINSKHAVTWLAPLRGNRPGENSTHCWIRHQYYPSLKQHNLRTSPQHSGHRDDEAKASLVAYVLETHEAEELTMDPPHFVVLRWGRSLRSPRSLRSLRTGG
jgi:hypothetical protein